MHVFPLSCLLTRWVFLIRQVKFKMTKNRIFQIRLISLALEFLKEDNSFIVEQVYIYDWFVNWFSVLPFLDPQKTQHEQFVQKCTVRSVITSSQEFSFIFYAILKRTYISGQIQDFINMASVTGKAKSIFIFENSISLLFFSRKQNLH